MKKHKKDIIVFSGIILLATVICIILLFINSNWFRMLRVKEQLFDNYGVKFVVTKEDTATDKKKYLFMVCSEEGVRSYAYCDWKGKLLSDSYAHYYYAFEMSRMIGNILEKDFDDFYVVRDCLEYGSNKTVYDFVEEEKTVSFDDYISHEQLATVTFRVYVRQGVTRDQLQKALVSLKKSGIDYSVYFIEVSDKEYNVIKKSGLICYYPFSGVSERLLENSENVQEEEIRDIVLNPFDYTVAEYVPKLDISRIGIRN